MSSADGRTRARWMALSLGLAGLAFVGYCGLTPPVCGDGDAGEFTLTLSLLGVPHPTGYPLYTLFGHFFVRLLHLAGAGWPRAANVWSAMGAAVAVFLFHRLAERICRRLPREERVIRLAATLLPVMFLAANPVWISVAVVAEVHTWHVAWLAGISLFALNLLDRDGGSSPGIPLQDAALWGGLCGAGLAHHVTAIFFAVPLTLLLLAAAVRRHKFRARMLFAAAAGAAASLSSYAFVAWRAWHPARYQWPPLEPTAAGVLGHILGGNYGSYVGGFRPSATQASLLAGAIYPVIIPGLAALGAITALMKWRAGRAVLATLLCGAIAEGLFVLDYGVVDPVPYFLPLVAVALLAIPAGAVALPNRRHRFLVLIPVTLVVATALACWIPQGFAQRRRLIELDQLIHRRWSSIPFQQGFIFWTNDLHSRLLVYQLLGNERPGLMVTNPNMLTFNRPRRVFEERTGIDALQGISLRQESDIDKIQGNVQRQTGLPVIDFDAVLGQRRQ